MGGKHAKVKVDEKLKISGAFNYLICYWKKKWHENI